MLCTRFLSQRIYSHTIGKIVKDEDLIILSDTEIPDLELVKKSTN